MRKTSKLLILAICISFTGIANAEEDSTKAYYHAYNICSPAAHYLTRQACNYGVVFERYYTDCMSQSGYGGESEAEGKNYYEGYMKAYNRCYSSAEQGAQVSCNYSASYQKHYNGCMAKHNFNERGEKISAGGNESSDSQNEKEGFQFNF